MRHPTIVSPNQRDLWSQIWKGIDIYETRPCVSFSIDHLKHSGTIHLMIRHAPDRKHQIGTSLRIKER